MSNIIKSMEETSYQYWLLGIPLILIIAHLTFKYLDFKTSKTEPKNLPKRYKLNKVTIRSFLITFIQHIYVIILKMKYHGSKKMKKSHLSVTIQF